MGNACPLSMGLLRERNGLYPWRQIYQEKKYFCIFCFIYFLLLSDEETASSTSSLRTVGGIRGLFTQPSSATCV